MKKKLQLNKETIAVLTGESMRNVIGGAGTPECLMNADCSDDKACINNKCIGDLSVYLRPAPSQICQVINHIPVLIGECGI